MTDILKLAEQVWGTDKWTQAQSERIQRFYDLAIADYRAKLIGVSVEPALYVPPKRDGEFHHEHASVAGYRSPTAGWEPLYTEEALAAAKLQAREEYRQELLGESVEPVAHVVSSGPADFPILQWKSADHSFRTKAGDDLYTAEALSARVEQMQGEIERLGEACAREFDSVQALDNENTILQSKLAQLEQDADHNAPWLSEAHALCSDNGIPNGHITERIAKLRDKVVQLENDVIERCATKCDEIAAKYQREHYASAETIADECGSAIRAMKE